jgi:hypothetical protein
MRSIGLVLLCSFVIGMWVACGPVVDEEPDPGDPIPGVASLSLSPSEVTAGSIQEVEVAVEHLDSEAPFLLSSDSSPEVTFLGSEEVTESGFVGSFFFGLLAEGEALWGLDDGNAEASDAFEVEALTSIPALGDGMAAAEGLLADAGAFGVWSLQAPADEILMLRAAQFGASEMVPRLWLLAADGLSVVASCCDMSDDAILTFQPAVAGDYYLRIDDANGAGGADFSFVVDRGSVVPAEPEEHSEAEPNDAVAQALDLGELGVGAWIVSAQLASGGIDGFDGRYTGDVDLVAFTPSEDCYASMSIDWDDSSGESEKAPDLDALIFDATEGEPSLAWDSDELVDTSLATSSVPERATLALTGGRTYLVLLASFNQVADLPYSFELVLVPATFPEVAR